MNVCVCACVGGGGGGECVNTISIIQYFINEGMSISFNSFNMLHVHIIFHRQNFVTVFTHTF